VADFDRYGAGRGVSDPALRTAWSNAHAGFIAQSVYLFAASEGLACWFRAMLDAAALSELLSLRSAEKALYSQGVGYPAKA
jgi:nitroreductase